MCCMDSGQIKAVLLRTWRHEVESNTVQVRDLRVGEDLTLAMDDHLATELTKLLET